MKIAVTSDIHLEFGDLVFHQKESADVLILGGDIMISQDLHDHPYQEDQININIEGLGKRQKSARIFRDFLKRCSDQFPHVIYIAGNHEFYHGAFPKGIKFLKEECSNYPNIYFLEMETKEIDSVTFVGSTLWTDFNKGDSITMYNCSTQMNDYRIIRNSIYQYRRLRPEDTYKRHRDSLQYIKGEVEKDSSKKYVVVGHHAPTKLSVKPRYENDYYLNGAYSSDLTEFILDHPQIKLWTHGHTHDQFDYMVGTTRIVCNPRGYINYERSVDDEYFTQIIEV